MQEDKLTHDERLRLECLAQANSTSPPNGSAIAIIEKAKRFEEYIQTGATTMTEKKANNER